MYVYKYIFYLYEKHQSPCANDYLSVPSDIALIYKNQLIMCNMTCISDYFLCQSDRTIEIYRSEHFI